MVARLTNQDIEELNWDDINPAIQTGTIHPNYIARVYGYKINELIRAVNGLAKIVNEYEQERATKA